MVALLEAGYINKQYVNIRDIVSDMHVCFVLSFKTLFTI